MVKDPKTPQAKGGLARAEALTSEERKAIARKAAMARWSEGVPEATHQGSFRIGSVSLTAAVLPNGKRLLTQGTFLKAIGRSRSPKGGTGVLSTADTVDGIPSFLQAGVLKSFVSDDLRLSTTPIFFLDKDGKRAVGYDAQILPLVADVFLQFRDACHASKSTIPHQYERIIRTCDIVMRGLATVGITALIDEATGYQDVRDRQALQAILDKFLRKEFAAWAKTFPDEFYRQIFRLRGWEWKGMRVNRPQIVAQYTKDLVYSRLAPGILRELEAKNPIEENGRRKAKHHQWLTEDVGHAALAQHLYALIGLMRISTSWGQLTELADRAYPKRGDTLKFAFMFDD